MASLCLLYVCLALPLVAAASPEPPVYSVTAKTLHDAGLQVGKMAESRIKGWLSGIDMQHMRGFVQGKGKEAFENMKQANSETFPSYADELSAIAKGAGVPVDDIWVANLLEELAKLMMDGAVGDGDHCSDVYAVSSTGYQGGFAHGHNEDWSEEIKKYWYFVEYHPLPGADFGYCAGHAYPGALVGWATTWNSHGMYLTQNALTPLVSLHGGLASAFIQKSAICGEAGAGGMDAVVKTLTTYRWGEGASLNLVDLKAKRMVNIETHLAQSKVTEVSETMGNYTHFNMYKELDAGKVDQPAPSTLHRQARADALAAPRSREDVMRILSDTSDKDYPIYRNVTLATFILNGSNGHLDIWCCGTAAASGKPPMYHWNILDPPVVDHTTDSSTSIVFM